MVWIVLALLSVNATLIVWLACVASGREEVVALGQQKQRPRTALDANGALQPVPVRVPVE